MQMQTTMTAAILDLTEKEYEQWNTRDGSLCTFKCTENRPLFYEDSCTALQCLRLI